MAFNFNFGGGGFGFGAPPAPLKKLEEYEEIQALLDTLSQPIPSSTVILESLVKFKASTNGRYPPRPPLFPCEKLETLCVSSGGGLPTLITHLVTLTPSADLFSVVDFLILEDKAKTPLEPLASILLPPILAAFSSSTPA